MYICFGLVASVLFIILLKGENTKRDRGERDEVIESQVGTHKAHLNEKNRCYTTTVDDVKTEKGDEWSGYRYVI